MPFIEWIDALGVGIGEIDDQHKVLIGKINELAAARESGRGRDALSGILKDLESYAAEHFALEERYFDRFQYGGATRHKEEHRAFERKVAEFSAAFEGGLGEVDAELLGFLKTWLTSHISLSDRKYKSTFIERGLR